MSLVAIGVLAAVALLATSSHAQRVWMQIHYCILGKLMHFCRVFMNWALMHSIFCIMQTRNPTGCKCPPHYVLNSHFQCVRQVSPTGCSCPTNYQLNSHKRCECVPFNSCDNQFVWNRDTCRCEPSYPYCQPFECNGIAQIRPDCICPPHWDGIA